MIWHRTTKIYAHIIHDQIQQRRNLLVDFLANHIGFHNCRNIYHLCRVISSNAQKLRSYLAFVLG
jgi:hypothetical protein